MAHASPEELSRKLAEAGARVEVGGRYAHFKDPTRTYEVTGLAIMEADEGVAVVYAARYGTGTSFVRPLASFCSMVEYEGRMVPRFSQIG